MNGIVIITGSRGCTTTRQAGALVRHFKKDQLIVEWDGRSALPDDCLALTDADVEEPPPGARVVRQDRAFEMAGIEYARRGGETGP